MVSVADKFKALAVDDAPGQEGRQQVVDLSSIMRGDVLPGRRVDFSHGDVDAHPPTPGAEAAFAAGFAAGGSQAYTEYRGSLDIRAQLADHLAAFTGAPVDAAEGLLLTPGTQGALFLAIAATVGSGDKVAIVQPDYFANRKLTAFFGGEMIPLKMDYLSEGAGAGLDLSALREAFQAGAKVFLFSNPNNPTGAVYSAEEIAQIAGLAAEFGVTVIADQLYSRLQYSGQTYTHLRAAGMPSDQIVTIMGPSKTESLSGFRLGVAFGAPDIIARMEQLQAIVSLRAPGYNQAVLRTWFNEPGGWMAGRIRVHEAIRDDLLKVFRDAGFATRTPQAGSYLFPTLPELAVGLRDFVRLLREQAGVIVTPGTEFGPHPSSIRLNYSQDHAAAVAAAERIVQMAERYRTSAESAL